MCEDCGCAMPALEALATSAGSWHAAPRREPVDFVRRILHSNDEQARHNRAHFDRHGVVAINLMSSPGAGKTSLLEATIVRLRDRFRIAVVEGDLETDNDARRIRAHGVPAVQITTGTACHLDAALVHDALHHLPLEKLDLLFIENIGNLVCPATFALGQHRNVTLLSVTEGDDKPAKYPVMFRASDLVLLSKTDLLPHLPEFSSTRAREALEGTGASAEMFEITARAPISLDPWLAWLSRTIDTVRAGRSGAPANARFSVTGSETDDGISR